MNKNKLLIALGIIVLISTISILHFTIKETVKNKNTEEVSTKQKPLVMEKGAHIEPNTFEYKVYDCTVPIESRSIIIDGVHKVHAEKIIQDALIADLRDLDPWEMVVDNSRDVESIKKYSKISEFIHPVTGALDCSYFTNGIKIVDTYVSQNYAAVEIESYSDWGGAHPNTYTTNVNIDLRTEKQITYAEYAQSVGLSTDVAKIKKIITADLKNQALTDKPNGMASFSDIEPDSFEEKDFPNRQWKITPGGILFNNLYYGHAAASLRVTIPVNELIR